MGGGIFFKDHHWAARSSITWYVMDWLAKQLPDGELKSEVQEYADNNVLLLDLTKPGTSCMVDIIANDLSRHVESIEDPVRRENIRAMVAELIEYAKEDQSNASGH